SAGPWLRGDVHRAPFHPACPRRRGRAPWARCLRARRPPPGTAPRPAGESRSVCSPWPTSRSIRGHGLECADRRAVAGREPLALGEVEESLHGLLSGLEDEGDGARAAVGLQDL